LIELISLSESGGGGIGNVTKNHTSSVSLHYLVKCQVSYKSNNWKQDDFCNNTS